jgi:hypothetical protein
VIRLYLAIGATLLALGFGVWLRSVVRENDSLKQEVRQQEELRIEAENNTVFQQNIGTLKDFKIGDLMTAKKRNATELATWKEKYDALIDKPENRAWGDADVPVDVRDSLRQRPPRQADGVRGSDEARNFVQRLRDAATARDREEPGPAPGDQDSRNRAGGLRGPSPNRP